MTATEQMFKFPFRVFDSEEKTDFTIGWKRVFFDEIKAFGDVSQLREIDEVEEKGFDSCVLYMEYGDEFVCAWKREKFEKEYNKHSEQLKQYKLKQDEQKSTGPEEA